MPASDETFWAWATRVLGGVTSAHGINRLVDPDNGVLRVVIWLGIVVACSYALVFFVESTLRGFLSAGVVRDITYSLHDGTLPMTTVCNESPIRCGCEAFYDERVRDNYLDRVLPFLCKDALVFKEAMVDPLDSVTGQRLSYTTLESLETMVDLQETRAKMRNFTRTINCDSGVFTKEWVLQRLVDGNLRQMDVIKYAGYTHRDDLIKECKTVDNTASSKTFGHPISCMDDRWWSPPWVDTTHGVCHTLSPCHGFPVGQACDNDQECEHELNYEALKTRNSDSLSNLPPHAKVTGGYCHKELKTCICTACAAGTDCITPKQLNPGRGRGIRLGVWAGVEADAVISSARASRWHSGIIFHLHSHADTHSVSQGMSIGAGQVSDVTVQLHELKEKAFPYTGCSPTYNVAPDVCRTNCLLRAQATNCCGQTVTNISKGKFEPLVYSATKESEKILIHNPVLLCNILDPEVRSCFHQQVQAMATGQICQNGALGMTAGYLADLMYKSNMYDDRFISTKTGLSKMEVQSQAIQKQCVWTFDVGGETETDNGKSCLKDNECKSSQGKVDGKCMEAFRAFCPSRCLSRQYTISSVATATIAPATLALLAARELALVSMQSEILKTEPKTLAFKPRCARVNGHLTDTPDCFTPAEAEKMVRQNYVMLNLDYTSFEYPTSALRDEVSYDTLIANIGGTMALFLGLSVCTLFEWLEFVLYSLFAAPLFVAGYGAMCVRSRAEPHQEDMDADARRVLLNIRTIAHRRKTAPTAPRDNVCGDLTFVAE